MKEEYDVVVVGAGPAGSVASFLLAGWGFRVLVVEKDLFPREKVCGDGIAPRAVHSLQALGLEGDLEGRFLRTRGIRFYATHGGVTEVRYPMGSLYPDHGYVAPRRDLDFILARRAREAGAELWDGWRFAELMPFREGRIPGLVVEREGERREVRAVYILGADGPLSSVGRSLGLLRNDPLYMGVSLRAYMTGVRGVSDFLEIYPEDAISPGCGWIFPLGGGRANVGVGFMLYARRFRDLNLNRLWETFLTRTRYAAEKLASAETLERPRGAILRVGLKGSCPRRANVILAGDAASMTNPISGEGITYALESGRWAAETLAAALHRGNSDILEIYPRILSWYYGRYFHQGTLAIRYGNRPEFVNPLLFVTSRFSRLGDKMGRFLMNCRRSFPSPASFFSLPGEPWAERPPYRPTP